MKKNTFCSLMAAMLCLGALLLVNACASQPPQEEKCGFILKRGTNLSHWLSQSPVRGEERANHIQEDDFARLESLGFDHVRIPIDEVQFWDEEGNQIPEAWNLLTMALDLARKHNLRAIVDLHIIRAHNFNAENSGETNSLFTSEEAQEGLIDLWKQLSEVLKPYSTDWVAYEFMNEPVADEAEQWNQLIAKVHAALRELEPERTLVIGSNRWQGVETFKDLRVPEGDKNIILSFHYYNPMAITHRGAGWTPVGKYNGPITYPGQLISDEDFNALPEELKPVMKHATQNWGKEMIHAQMKDAIDVAAKYGLQLFCGEWGVYEPVDRELAYAWTKDMLEVFDEFNVAWTTWCYDADFGFWDQKSESFKDKKLVDLLMSGKGL
ncbi:MAG: glycoside hydrolase family 5 protein [Bacteroidaceae bacterium]|nr:glycoside hydrolase family 5 protein [Bacteroidaceae bacterium]